MSSIALNGLRVRIRQFTPNWFTVIMGTGIAATLLDQGFNSGTLLHHVARVLWLGNSVAFLAFCLAYAARWALFPREAQRILFHPTMALFLGAIPMALAGIVGGLLVFGVDLLGPSAVRLAAALWWLDVLLALASAVIVPFSMMTRQTHALPHMTGLWLLPVVAAEVAAATGAVLLPHVADPHAAFAMLLVCYAMWGVSVPIAMGLLAILLLRLVLHGVPPANLIASCWLPLGPIGTGALALLSLGHVAVPICSAVGLADLGTFAHLFGLLGGTILCGYGVWWLLLAVMCTLRVGIAFGLGCWGFIFPPGVLALAVLVLGHQSDVPALVLVGRGLAVCVLGSWCVVAARTIGGAWRGDLFVAPCLLPDIARA